MKLREDTDQYCLLWVGVLILATYYFNFLFLFSIGSADFTPFVTLSLPLLGIPLVLISTFMGYLRPERGKAKPNALALSVVFSLFYMLSCIFAYDLFNAWNFSNFIESMGFASWGIGSAILTAGGLSIMQSFEDSVEGDILDLSKLHYPPGEIPEPESENSAQPEIAEPDVPEAKEEPIPEE